MTPLEAIQARKQRATIDHGWAVQAREAAQAAEREASHAMRAAKAEADDAEEWAALAKAARRRVLAAKPEDIAAFGSARSYGADESRWVELGWRKQKTEHIFRMRETVHHDTPAGTAARILHRRGREWCGSLEATP